ncbi:tyrosine-protein phosphatase [Nocardia arizonensis]|uniref:tyrosine-protein phosphatase n=1 Tax=Nocardia arizonensis TaxID=1141647 RepID=UPI0006D12211|nr:tyrosine-protein phosphatase [Nocardia arizonensis]
MTASGYHHTETSAARPDRGPTANRWVDFAEIDNVRDLGGLPVIGGGRTRFGVAYRASTPQHMTAADLALLLGPLALRTVIDLRNTEEVMAEGYGRLTGAGVHTVNLPVRTATAAAATPADPVPIGDAADLTRMYRELLSGSAESVVSAVRLIADGTRHSVVFHCAAGKDRTGLLAAIVLDAVGVPAAEIAADYAMTDARLDRIRARLAALSSYPDLPPARTGILSAEPATMLGFLAGIATDYGGAAGWLSAHGLGATELRRLRTVLVDPPA